MDKEQSLRSRRESAHFMTEKNAFLILIVLYVVGTVAFALKIHPEFARLTPLNLMISVAFALYFHQKWSSRMYFFVAACAIFGFVIEMIGVNTGLIFGHYTYDFALGFKVFNTPLSISINWLLTT
ncbi:MAG: carotenoid biosynthesis protein, partial [Saprospiraceae bacterium]|nr:carotenoid biosynthesis protein [Saprospiraceae bacterium]